MTTNRRDLLKSAIAAVGTPALASTGVGIAGLLTACGGGGDSGPPSPNNPPSVTAPTGLSYSSPVQAILGKPITPMSPTVTGTVASYSVNPALPTGLSLDSATGKITGTPTVRSSRASYTVSAVNAGGTTKFDVVFVIAGALAILSVSNKTPTALTPITLVTDGLDVNAPFTITLKNATGYNAVLKPIRVTADGKLVVAAPLYLDPNTGRSSGLSASIQIVQGTAVSDLVPLAVSDIPALSTYGLRSGEISRAFFNAQAVYLGLSVNALQVMRALPAAKTNTSTVQQHAKSQQLNIIKARDNIDLIVSGSQSSLSLGSTPSGVAVAFNTDSVDMMDRIIAMYLQSIGYLPSTIYAVSTVPVSAQLAPHRIAKANATHSGLALKATPSPKAIIDALGGVGGAIGLTNAAIQQNAAGTSIDNLIAIGQGVGAAGVLFGTGLGIVAASPALIAAGVIVGTGFAVAAVVNDSYKWYTASNAIDAAGQLSPAELAAAQKMLADAKANLTVDSLGLVLGAFGLPSAVAGELGIGSQVVSILAKAQSGGAGLAVQGAGLITGIAGLVVTAKGNDLDADKKTMDASNSEVPSIASSLGVAYGRATIQNANDPILQPLTGIYLKETNTSSSFTTLADINGNYDMIVPLNVPNYSYSQMQLQPYDPVTSTSLSGPVTVDLSTLSASKPINVSPLSGTCSDTDASSPDQDDPDCD